MEYLRLEKPPAHPSHCAASPSPAPAPTSCLCPPLPSFPAPHTCIEWLSEPKLDDRYYLQSIFRYVKGPLVIVPTSATFSQLLTAYLDLGCGRSVQEAPRSR